MEMSMSFIAGLTDREVSVAMWIAGGLITLIFTLLSFFVVRGVNIQDKLSEAVTKLQITLSGMNAIITSIQDEKCEFKRIYEARHDEIQTQVNELEEIVEDHGNRITRIETKVEIS